LAQAVVEVHKITNEVLMEIFLLLATLLHLLAVALGDMVMLFVVGEQALGVLVEVQITPLVLEAMGKEIMVLQMLLVAVAVAAQVLLQQIQTVEQALLIQ
jgi:hypothetical protein